MNYTKTITDAVNGNKEALAALYEDTQNDMYYIALKYTKNKEDAMDVVQDAYIKAWQYLTTLKDPESVRSWLSRIVASTAKNLLSKKNPTLFSQIEPEDQDDGFIYDKEDENRDYQPEPNYTKKETQELVREMIDSLSDEQRLYILMFYLEGQSIKDIARSFEISENTVKSRLNYGRKALKKKADELEQKGYKLLGISPISLLLYLLRQEKFFPEIQTAANIAKEVCKKEILNSIGEAASHVGKGVQTAAGKSAAAGAKTAATHTFIHTALGKTLIGLLSVAIVAGGATVAVKLAVNSNNQPTEAITETVETTESTTETTEPTTENTEPKDFTEGMYPTMIAGNLTMDEFKYILSYGPKEMTDSVPTQSYAELLNYLCEPASRNGNYIADLGNTSDWKAMYSLSDVNRLFSSFTDFRFTADNASQANAYVSGDAIIFSPATVGHMITSDITSAKYTDDELIIDFTYNYTSGGGSGSYTLYKEAVLVPNSEGLYQITDIYERSEEEEPTEAETSQTQDSQSSQSSQDSEDEVIKLYQDTINRVKAKESGFAFTTYPDSSYNGEYSYFIRDLNNDGKPELVVAARAAEGPFIVYNYRVYGYGHQGDTYTLKTISDDLSALNLLIPEDGNGLFIYNFSRGIGEENFHRATIENDSFVISSTSEYTYTMGTDASNQFHSANPSAFPD